MKSVIKVSKTIDEAIEEALVELGVSRDSVEVEVMEEPSKGFLGLIGGREAVVKVSLLDKDEDQDSGDIEDLINEIKEDLNDIEENLNEIYYQEEKEEDNELELKQDLEGEELNTLIEDFLKEVIKSMSLDYEGFNIEERDGHLYVEILGVDSKDMGIIIGKRGSTLDSLQYLLSLVVNKDRKEYQRILLDINDYRAKREETLISLANRMGDKALATGRYVKLEPMNPYERRIIHSALQKREELKTYSEGSEPRRRVVIERR